MDSGGIVALSVAEDMLMKKVYEGNLTAVMFFLRTHRSSFYNRNSQYDPSPLEDEFENADLFTEIQDIMDEQNVTNITQQGGVK